MRDRPACTAIANEQRVEAEYTLVFPRELTHQIVLAGGDAPDAREGEPARECIGAGEVQDLELAVAHGLGEQPGVLIDDHGSQIELTGLELGELLVHAVGRQTQVKIGERGNHLMHEAGGAAAAGPDPDALAAQVGQLPELVGVQAKEHERLGLTEAADKLERVVGGPVHTLLDEGEVDVARCLRGDQPLDVLNRACRREIVDVPPLLLRLGGEGTDHRVVVPTLAPRQDRHPQVGEVGRAVGPDDQQADQRQQADQQGRLQAGGRGSRAAAARGHVGTALSLVGEYIAGSATAYLLPGIVIQ